MEIFRSSLAGKNRLTILTGQTIQGKQSLLQEAAHRPDLFHIGMSLSLSQTVLGLKQSKV